MKYFGSIDQGTTSTKFIVFNEVGKVIAKHQQEFKQYLPNEVSVEHDPEEIWASVVNCIDQVNKEFSIEQLDSIGITNQRETTVAWRKSTGKVLHNALVWQDTRTQNICDELKENDLPEDLKGKSTAEIKAYVAEQRKEREAIQSEIAELNEKRRKFIASKKGESDNALESAMIQALKKQAEKKNYIWQ